MNIGIFTDTYFPQVSGVSTSIRTLKEALEEKGHNVYIFTTTDPHVNKGQDEENVYRFSSIPFVSFTDRRIAVRGLFEATKIAKELNIEIVHTQTEFSMGLIGKHVAKKLKVPKVHTYHTMYESYLHYILNGRVLKPHHVKQMSKSFLKGYSGVVAPSQRVLNTLEKYGILGPYSVIPTGVNLKNFKKDATRDIRQEYGIKKDEKLLLSLSRLSSEKGIDRIIANMPDIIKENPNSKLLVVGDGPQKEELEQDVEKLGMDKYVTFVGQVDNRDVGDYYKAADVFLSASDSESQGLTYIEAMSSGAKIVAYESDYLKQLLDDPSLGMTYKTDQEFVKDVTKYLQTPPISEDAAIREAKLYDISAEQFSFRVMSFYLDCLERYTAPTSKQFFLRSSNDKN